MCVMCCVCMCVCARAHAPSCPTLCDPMDCSPPGSSVHGIFQARILEWVSISYFRGSSDPGMETTSLVSPALAGRFFNTGPPGKPLTNNILIEIIKTQKITCLWLHLHEMSMIGTSRQRRLVVTSGWDQFGMWSDFLMVWGFLSEWWKYLGTWQRWWLHVNDILNATKLYTLINFMLCEFCSVMVRGVMAKHLSCLTYVLSTFRKLFRSQCLHHCQMPIPNRYAIQTINSLLQK